MVGYTWSEELTKKVTLNSTLTQPYWTLDQSLNYTKVIQFFTRILTSFLCTTFKFSLLRAYVTLHKLDGVYFSKSYLNTSISNGNVSLEVLGYLGHTIRLTLKYEMLVFTEEILSSLKQFLMILRSFLKICKKFWTKLW